MILKTTNSLCLKTCRNSKSQQVIPVYTPYPAEIPVCPSFMSCQHLQVLLDPISPHTPCPLATHVTQPFCCPVFHRCMQVTLRRQNLKQQGYMSINLVLAKFSQVLKVLYEEAFSDLCACLLLLPTPMSSNLKFLWILITL